MLSSDRIKELIESDESLATFKADTSVAGSAASEFLASLGAKGIPLIVIDSQNQSTPIQADFYTISSLIELIDQARKP